MKEETLHFIVKKIAEGLKYLHNKGIVHRDIKAENILMSDKSDEAIPTIADFGFARRLEVN